MADALDMPASPALVVPTPAVLPPAVNPFGSELALRHSQYFYTTDGRSVSRGGSDATPDLFASAAVAAFRGFVQNPQFSCVGAKSAVATDSARLGVYDTLSSDEATAGLARDLWTFTRDPASRSDTEFVTFVAVFKEPTDLDEGGFEGRLWEQLRRLNRLDAPHHAYDPTVSPDADDPHFGFSFAGTAFFVVGLHPHSSREARRFPWPLLAFNPHAQFLRLREAGQWARMQEVVRTQ
jgi:FPC/CPF motif-containing protein YcgG